MLENHYIRIYGRTRKKITTKNWRIFFMPVYIPKCMVNLWKNHITFFGKQAPETTLVQKPTIILTFFSNDLKNCHLKIFSEYSVFALGVLRTSMLNTAWSSTVNEEVVFDLKSFCYVCIDFLRQGSTFHVHLMEMQISCISNVQQNSQYSHRWLRFRIVESFRLRESLGD